MNRTAPGPVVKNVASLFLLLSGLAVAGASCSEDGDVITDDGGAGGGLRCDDLPDDCEGRAAAQGVAAIQAVHTRTDAVAAELALQCQALSVALGGAASEVAPTGDPLTDAEAWCAVAQGRVATLDATIQMSSAACVFVVGSLAACEAACVGVATCESQLEARCPSGAVVDGGCSDRPLSPPAPCNSCPACTASCAIESNASATCAPGAVTVELAVDDPPKEEALRAPLARVLAAMTVTEILAEEMLDVAAAVTAGSQDARVQHCQSDTVPLIEVAAARLERVMAVNASLVAALAG